MKELKLHFSPGIICRMVHAFTSCGLLPQQYKSMGKAARMGFVNDHYIAGSKSRGADDTSMYMHTY
jgi:hypothetical protein